MQRTVFTVILGLGLAALFALAMSGIRAEPREDTPPPPPAGMVLIPAGSFEMGSADDDADDDEQPVHTIHLDAFFMDKYEVTNAQFKAFVDANPHWQKSRRQKSRFNRRFHGGDYLEHWDDNTYPSGKAEHPVVYVSWYAAMAYAEWAGKRLPTEAEWEYAARGGLAGQRYPWGNTLTHNDAHFWLEFYTHPGLGGLKAVGQYADNGYGLYDVAGNVWEWCLDKYDADFYDAHNSRNPISGAVTLQAILDNFASVRTLSSRVLRGGSWYREARDVRVANRGASLPGAADPFIGFRCVRDVPR